MGSCKLDLAVLTSLISHGRLAAPQHTVAASTEEGHLVIEPQLGREMADKMLQSGLSRLKSVLTGGGGGGGGGDHQDRARCRQHGGLVRSSSHNPRSDLARQIISKVGQTDRLTVLTVEIFYLSLSLYFPEAVSAGPLPLPLLQPPPAQPQSSPGVQIRPLPAGPALTASAQEADQSWSVLLPVWPQVQRQYLDQRPTRGQTQETGSE